MCFRDITSGRQHFEVPLEDQQTSLNLLLEMALQKGTLSSMLDMVLLLLNLWNKKAHPDDNRSLSHTFGVPIVPFLKRLEQIPFYPEYLCKGDPEEMTCTKTFLKFTNLVEDENAEIDLRQAATFITAHLDRLAEPHIAMQSFHK